MKTAPQNMTAFHSKNPKPIQPPSGGNLNTTKTMKTKQLEEAVTKAGNFFQEQYIDYMNSYLTIAKFALDKNLTQKQARQQIEIGRKIHHQRTSK